MKRQILLLIFIYLFSLTVSYAQATDVDSLVLRSIYDKVLTNDEAYEQLKYLCKGIGARSLGSSQDHKTTEWAERLFKTYKLDKVHPQKLKVSVWNRGKEPAYAEIIDDKENIEIPAIALMGSVSTSERGILSEVIEIRDLNHLKEFQDYVNGKIVFFNFKLNPQIIDPTQAYHLALEQLQKASIESAKLGAQAIIFRSLTLMLDDIPRTEQVVYDAQVPKIPSMAMSTHAADLLSQKLRVSKLPAVKMNIKQMGESAEEGDSFNIIAEIKGTSNTEKVIVLVANIHSSDLGEAAQSAAKGIQTIYALNTLKALGIRPKNTLRIVLTTGDDVKNQGVQKYLETYDEETHLYAVESIFGGFLSKGFCVQGFENDKAIFNMNQRFLPYNVEYRTATSIDSKNLLLFKGKKLHRELSAEETVLITDIPNNQRYIDLQNSVLDTFETINKRELQLRIANYASLLYLLDKQN